MHNTVVESYIAKNVLGIEDCWLLGIPNLLPTTIESPSIDKLTEEGYINGRFSGVLSPTAYLNRFPLKDSVTGLPGREGRNRFHFIIRDNGGRKRRPHASNDGILILLTVIT
jgi:hypothetical protein